MQEVATLASSCSNKEGQTALNNESDTDSI